MPSEIFLPSVHYNALITPGFGFTSYGAGLFGDDSDSSGGYVNADGNAQSFGVSITDNNKIPTTASVTQANVLIRVAEETDDMHPQTFIYNSGASRNGSVVLPTTYPTFLDATQSWTTDAFDNAWTRTNFFEHKYGCYMSAAAATRTLYLSEIKVTAVFTLAAATVTTVAATNITSTSATLNGTVNPNGANSYYPVTYSWLHGLTSNPTTPLSGGTATGSSNQNFSNTLSGLTPNTIYYFKFRGANASNTTDGSVLSFSTLAVDQAVGRF